MGKFHVQSLTTAISTEGLKQLSNFLGFVEPNIQSTIKQTLKPFHHYLTNPCIDSVSPCTKKKILEKTCNNEHDWNLITYLNVLHHNRTQKQLQHFFNILQKYCQIPILDTLSMSGHFHQK